MVAGAGCKSSKPLVSSENTQNSTLISERYDSVHTVAGDSATAALLFRCDSMGNVYLAELQTEHGKRINMELAIKGLQKSLDSALNQSPQVIYKNTPMYVKIDCKEDSFEVVVRGLRERIAYYEENKQIKEVPVRYIPDFYKNCTKGFWALLVMIIIALALLLWKNWGKVAAWVIKLYARIKF